jgi:hypothetical protein
MGVALGVGLARRLVNQLLADGTVLRAEDDGDGFVVVWPSQLRAGESAES